MNLGGINGDLDDECGTVVVEHSITVRLYSTAEDVSQPPTVYLLSKKTNTFQMSPSKNQCSPTPLPTMLIYI